MIGEYLLDEKEMDHFVKKMDGVDNKEFKKSFSKTPFPLAAKKRFSEASWSQFFQTSCLAESRLCFPSQK